MTKPLSADELAKMRRLIGLEFPPEVMHSLFATIDRLVDEIAEWKEWGEGQMNDAVSALERLGKYDALADFASRIMETVKAGDDHAPLWELTSAMAMMKDD